MAHQPPLKYVFYIATTPEKVWEGFVSRESNRIIFSGAEFQADFKPGGSLAWGGPGTRRETHDLCSRKGFAV
jgi:hypothetical protein